MKIVIPSNDKTTLAPRSGRAKFFIIFDIENQELIKTTIIENMHNHEQHKEDHSHHKHEHGHSHANAVEQLTDCDLMITQKVGPHFEEELNNANIEIKICQETLIKNVLKHYL